MPSAINTTIPADGVNVVKSDLRNLFSGIKTELNHGGFAGFTPANYAPVDDKIKSHLQKIDNKFADVLAQTWSTPKILVPGGVARLPSDKIRERVSVKDFGALGDGVSRKLTSTEASEVSALLGGDNKLRQADTNDTIDWAAILKAENYLGDLGGGILYFPPGIYPTFRPILRRDYVTWMSDGPFACMVDNVCNLTGDLWFEYYRRQVAINGLFHPIAVTPGGSATSTMVQLVVDVAATIRPGQYWVDAASSVAVTNANIAEGSRIVVCSTASFSTGSGSAFQPYQLRQFKVVAVDGARIFLNKPIPYSFNATKWMVFVAGTGGFGFSDLGGNREPFFVNEGSGYIGMTLRATKGVIGQSWWYNGFMRDCQMISTEGEPFVVNGIDTCTFDRVYIESAVNRGMELKCGSHDSIYQDVILHSLMTGTSTEPLFSLGDSSERNRFVRFSITADPAGTFSGGIAKFGAGGAPETFIDELMCQATNAPFLVQLTTPGRDKFDGRWDVIEMENAIIHSGGNVSTHLRIDDDLIYGIHNLKVSGVISAVPSVSLQDGHAGYISGFQPEIASYGIGDSGKAYCSRIRNVIGTVKSRLLEDNYMSSKECKFTRAFLTDELRFAVRINDDGDWALAEWAVPLPREDGVLSTDTGVDLTTPSTNQTNQAADVRKLMYRIGLLTNTDPADWSALPDLTQAGGAIVVGDGDLIGGTASNTNNRDNITEVAAHLNLVKNRSAGWDSLLTVGGVLTIYDTNFATMFNANTINKAVQGVVTSINQLIKRTR